jgi:hypothetical protein
MGRAIFVFFLSVFLSRMKIFVFPSVFLLRRWTVETEAVLTDSGSGNKWLTALSSRYM